MITQAQLLAKNNPTTAKQFIFKLGDADLPCVILDLVDDGMFSGNDGQFQIQTPGLLYQFIFEVWPDSTNATIWETLYIYFNDDFGTLTKDYFENEYFSVRFFAGKVYIILRKPEAELINTIDPAAMTFTDGTFDDSYVLKFAPDGWEDDEYKLQRDMKLFGVFRKFTIAEMKFVKDGRDYLLQRYEATGVNTDTTLTVTENTPSGITRVRFIGKIDYSTFKRTELSVDVQVIDGAFTDLVLRRSKTDVDLYALKSIDGATLPAATTKTIIRPELKLNQFANWTSGTGTITETASHILRTSVLAGEYEEARGTASFSEYLFLNAEKDYLAAMIYTDIVAVAHGNDANAYFSWSIRLDRYSGGSYVDNIWTENFICEGLTTDIVISNAYGINLLEGESLKIHAVYTPSIGTGNIVYDAFEGIKYKFNWLVVNYPESTVKAMLYHEAFERIIYILTGYSGRFKSDFLGRTDLGYAADGTALGAIATGRDFNGANFWNATLTTSLDKLFEALQSKYCLGMGIEIIGGVEKIVIEPMEHFFNNTVVLNISDRLAPETIEKQYYPELSFNRISVGFDSYEYKSLGGIYEFNTTSKYSTVIKPVDKELNIVSPIRGDMSGIIECLELGGSNYDSSVLEEVFIFDSIRDGSDFIIRTNELFEYVDNISNRDTLINLMLSPARSIRNWGSYIRGFLEKYLTSFLNFQSSNKNTKLVSTEWGGEKITENANILVSTLNEPLWHTEIFTVEVPALENDIELIKDNPYGLVRISDTEYGWIISYRSKNENKKSEYTLLRCNTDYVTPNGDPIYPATIKIKKVITGLPDDASKFLINIVGGNGVSYNNLVLLQGLPIELTNVPYGTYTIEEVGIPNGYSLVSISPNPMTIDADNLHFYVEVVNEVDDGEPALELRFDSPVAPEDDRATLGYWNTSMNLPTNGTAFTSIEVVGDTVKLRGGANINLNESSGGLWGVIGIIDNIACIVSVENAYFINFNFEYEVNMKGLLVANDGFHNCIFYSNAYFPVLETITTGSFSASTFSENVSFPKVQELISVNFDTTAFLKDVDFPILETVQVSFSRTDFFGFFTAPLLNEISGHSFSLCRFYNNLVLPSLTLLGQEYNEEFSSAQFTGLVSFPILETLFIESRLNISGITALSLPALINCGPTVDYDLIFSMSGETFTLTIPAALMTCNGGNPDGDIQYLIDNNTVTIITV